MKRNMVIASVLALVLAVGLVVMALRSRDLQQRLRAMEDDRASACDQARFVAIGAVHAAVLSAKIAKGRGMGTSIADGSGRALAVYIWACADEDDRGTKEMAKVLSDRVSLLLRAGELEALAALEAKLDETPLEAWKTLTLPAQPSLGAVLSGGDEDGTERPSE